jgi:hypothetical protein
MATTCWAGRDQSGEPVQHPVHAARAAAALRPERLRRQRVSDWRAATITGTQIIKVEFDVFVGRTSVEVIQIQSLIYPWGITVVRTITIDRSAGGVLRHDSGWQPVSDGIFSADPSPGTYSRHIPARCRR